MAFPNAPVEFDRWLLKSRTRSLNLFWQSFETLGSIEWLTQRKSYLPICVTGRGCCVGLKPFNNPSRLTSENQALCSYRLSHQRQLYYAMQSEQIHQSFLIDANGLVWIQSQIHTSKQRLTLIVFQENESQ